jgi:hypothetical protein
MKFKKIELGRQTNFILALLFIHFIFFGYLSNVYFKDIGENVMFLYKVMFSPQSYLSTIILFAIVFYMAFREKFFEYGIRNSIWLIPFTIGMSWIWYWFILLEIDAVNIFDIFVIIGNYFLRWEAYITILTLLGVNLVASILASIARIQYNNFLARVKKIEI